MPAATDAKTISLGMLNSSKRLFTKDLEAFPEDAFTRSFGPSCRTVADLVFEVNMVNDHIRLTITGQPLFDWPDGWIKAPADFNTKEKIVGAYTESMTKFIEAIEGFSEDEMLVPISNEGKETNRYERCRFVCVHNWYHSGQFNFMQTLLGDGEMHWG